MSTTPTPEELVKGDDGGVQEDRIYFGMTVTHPGLGFVMLDPFAEAAEDLKTRRPDMKDLKWEDVDKELGLQCKATPFIVINGQATLITEEKLQWLAVQAQSIAKILESTAALADPTWASFRRSLRGEDGKK